MNKTPTLSSQVTTTVARNSLWFGLDVLMNFGVSFVASVLIARSVGPVKLGYFNYVVWLTTITSTLGSFGLPATARKYVSEFLGSGEPGMVRAVFIATLKVQALVAALCVLVGLGVVFAASDADYLPISVVLVLVMAPRMVLLLPSEVNAAAENMAANTPPSVLGGVIQLVGVALSLTLGWGLLGIAIGWLIAYSLELGLKLRNVFAWMRPFPDTPLPPGLRKRMITFSSQGLVLMLLNIIVWDRSDILFLKAFNRDPRQITFFTLSFNLTEKLMMLPNIIGYAVGIGVMSQYARDRQRLSRMVPASAEYMLLFGLPLFAGVAAVAPSALRLLYGTAYLGVIPVFILAALFAIPKIIMSPAQRLLQASESQAFVAWSTGACGVLNIILDYALVSGWGAKGAALANGCAQLSVTLVLWIYCCKRFSLDWRVPFLRRLAGSVSAMAAVAFAVAWMIPTWYGLILAVACSALVLLTLIRVTRILGYEDHQRLLQLKKLVPVRLTPWYTRGIDFLVANAQAT